MSKVIKIKRGLDIKLRGKAEKILIKHSPAGFYAVKPPDFCGLMPKIDVSVGQEVNAGTLLFHDKSRPEIHFTSPVSGVVKSVNRGERRRILEVVIERTGNNIRYESFNKGNPLDMTREEVTANLLISGLWPAIRQRPYDIIANPADKPKAIFISAFDSAPLAPDYDFIIRESDTEFQTGINALTKLTKGRIHLNINADYPASQVFTSAKNVQLNRFTGPHPAGNVGIQIHHIDPINKGDIIWYLYPQDIISIGRLFLNGIYDASKIIALTGSEVLKPRYFKLISGSSISNIINDNVTEGCPRYISGNVLTGTKIQPDGFIGYYDSQVTVIPEGFHHEFLGWAMPGFKKYSATRTFWSWLAPGKDYRIDTNLNGGRRSFIITGQYEKVLPMDIYPMLLLKAILVEDIDLMENLGIYEVSPEDFALCEFVCVSKTEIQKIIRNGLDLMIKEMS
ncbi:MAG TPA: Na(+)-translocating NADH-quinone reductase subunit A [Bacteroidales bacterium]|nr:Na(+)-translocating NADH-quinone reductase subunit A [Bacteroidales bacterium]